MSPALPVLGLLVLACAVAGQRYRRVAGAARAAMVLGLAGMALLLPALGLQDGIPSPGAILGEHAPWRGTVDTAGGNPNLRDIPYQIEPWLLFLQRELRAGRPGFWNPHQFAGAPFWANGQSAPLFPLTWVFVLLPPGLGFVLLPWLRFVIGGLGAWFLARRLGWNEEGAVLAGIVFALSGMLVSMLLFPMANALVLVPWILGMTERLAQGEAAGALLAMLVGLQGLAGHPETAVHTAMLSGVYLLLRGGGRRPWSRFLAGWVLGGGLAAVFLLPLAWNVLESTKFLETPPVTRPPVAVVAREMLRLVLPQAHGHPAEGTWFGPFNYAATAVYAGAATLVLAAVGITHLRATGRTRLLLAVMGSGLFALLLAYHLPGLWSLIARVPLLSHVAHHRLLFGVELTLALLAGAGLDGLSPERRRAALAGALGVVAAVALGWASFGSDWESRGLITVAAGWSAWVAAAAALPVLACGFRRRWGLAAVLLPVVIATDLLAAHGGILRALPRSAHYPVTPAVAFLQGRAGRVVGTGWTLHPNAAMVYGLHDLRGDDPVKLARFERLYRRLAPADAVYFRPLERWDGGLLDTLGVRWVMTPPGETRAESGWLPVYQGSDAWVWERPGARPLVWGVGVTVMAMEHQPGRHDLRVHAAAPGLVVVAEMWDAGWRARRDGKPVTVAAIDPDSSRPADPAGKGALLGVSVPVGVSTVELRYRPPLLGTGAAVSLLTLVAVARWYRGSRRGVCDNPGRP